jgi:hypothetical protein
MECLFDECDGGQEEDERVCVRGVSAVNRGTKERVKKRERGTTGEGIGGDR